MPDGWSAPVSQMRKLRPRVAQGHVGTAAKGAAPGAAHTCSRSCPAPPRRQAGALQEPTATTGGQQRAGGAVVPAAARRAGPGEIDDTHCQCAQLEEISNPGARPPSLRVGIALLQPALLANEVCSLTPNFPPLGARAGRPPFPSGRLLSLSSSAAPTAQLSRTSSPSCPFARQQKAETKGSG